MLEAGKEVTAQNVIAYKDRPLIWGNRRICEPAEKFSLSLRETPLNKAVTIRYCPRFVWFE
jgi:hypothetical protein